MRARNILFVVSLAALTIAPLTSCQKNEQEAASVPQADNTPSGRTVNEMTSFELNNGMTVFLQEDTTYDEVAVEVFYRAGFCHEPAGKAQVSHLAEHAVVFSPTPSYPDRGMSEAIGRLGKINAEAVGDFVHFDFVVQNAKLEDVLKTASEQLTGLKFTESVREEQAQRAAMEISNILASDRGSISKFAMMTLMQAIYHGEKFVPIKQMNFDLTVEDLSAFHKLRYRTNDMILAIVGNMDSDDTRAMVEKYFGSIPAAPDPPRYSVSLAGDMNVTWDIEASAVFLVYPGPFDDERERAALVAFGGYLSQFITNNAEIRTMARTTYTTNVSYPVNNLPFFVFAQPETYRSPTEITNKIVQLVDQAIAALDQARFESVISGTQGLVSRSFLKTQSQNYQIQNHVLLGQHALDVGIKHYLKNGRSTEEYNAMLESITYEEMMQIVQKYISKDQRRVITVSSR